MLKKITINNSFIKIRISIFVDKTCGLLGIIFGHIIIILALRLGDIGHIEKFL